MEAMNRTRLLAMHKELCDEARALSERKNHDYSGGRTISTPS